MYLGIDCGTQSLKVIVFEPGKGVIFTSAQTYDLLASLPAGHKEQHPQTWIDALDSCLADLKKQGADLAGVKGIGVSGQQHGCVLLDKDFQVIRPAKLWCDTATEAQCQTILENAGGFSSYFQEIGNGLPAGFTASKILWLKENEPENYAKVAHIGLPHDYINWYLTGNWVTEAGDASGTGYFKVNDRAWSSKALGWIDPQQDLSQALPKLIEAQAPAGTVRSSLSETFGFAPDTVVSSGGGDNMMGAIGSGNVSSGMVTVSLGTSGTLFSAHPSPVHDDKGEIAAFCSSTGGWMPLGCTMNVTVATEMIRAGFFDGADVKAFDEAAASVPPGSDGLMLLPYLEGERLPNVPDGTGVYFGVRPQTANPAHFARAAMEGVTFGLNYGLDRFKELGITPDQIRLIGGGAKSKVWRQLAADIFNCPTVCLDIEEGPALGAALQAMWCHAKADIKSLVESEVKTDPKSNCVPQSEGVYQGAYQVYRSLSGALIQSGVFDQHREILGD